MKQATEMALQMLSENVAAVDGLDNEREKMDTRFKIATTATRLAECDKQTHVSHEWLGPKPPAELSQVT